MLSINVRLPCPPHVPNSNGLTQLQTPFTDTCRLNYGEIQLADGANEATTATFNDNTQSAKTILVLALNDEPADLEIEDESPVDVWKTLCDNYEKNTLPG